MTDWLTRDDIDGRVSPMDQHGITRSAAFSKDGNYRYTLIRGLEPVGILGSPDNRRTLVAIGLNPSTADHSVDDPTTVRLMGFARDNGYAVLALLNLFAFRSTDPRALRAIKDPIGPANDAALRHFATAGHDILLAWGVHGSHADRDASVLAMLVNLGAADRLRCFGRTKSGYPRHPLYLAAATPLMPYYFRH